MDCIYRDQEASASAASRHPAGTLTRGWNVGHLCDSHYQAVKKLYTTKTVSDTVADDFVKVHVLLWFNRDECLKRVQLLGDEIAKASTGASDADPRFAKAKRKGGDYLKLSRALEYYEGLCWFPANRVLLTGLVSAEGFFKSLRYGFNKDPGAGINHGDQSHRLQWHVIMRCMTNNFSVKFDESCKWRHSPLQLFYEYTQGAGSELKPSTWAVAMDRTDNLNWGNPDKVFEDVAHDGPSMIAQALHRRAEKMGGFTRDGHRATGTTTEALEKAAQKLYGTSLGQVGTPQTYGYPHRLEVYAGRKVGNVPGHLGKVYSEAKQENKELFGEEGEHTYREDDQNLLLKRHAPDNKAIDLALVKRSLGGLNNTQYKYAPTTGANPLGEVGGYRW